MGLAGANFALLTWFYFCAFVVNAFERGSGEAEGGTAEF